MFAVHAGATVPAGPLHGGHLPQIRQRSGMQGAEREVGGRPRVRHQQRLHHCPLFGLQGERLHL